MSFLLPGKSSSDIQLNQNLKKKDNSVSEVPVRYRIICFTAVRGDSFGADRNRMQLQTVNILYGRLAVIYNGDPIISR